MTVYAISYDLNRPGQAYDELYKAIKSVGSDWWHHLDSTWLVVTDKTALQVANALWAKMDQSDKLLVTPVGSSSAFAGFDAKGTDWLNRNL